ncbi:hypothetical protein ACA910_020934 [Epithemia clementina (nom. ined.)]
MDTNLTKLEESFQGMVEDLWDIREKSKILCNENPRVAKKTLQYNPLSIHFQLNKQTAGEVQAEYNANLMHDLELCRMDSTSGTVRD